MIDSKEALADYIRQDAAANRRRSVKACWHGDEVWKFQLTLRKTEYYTNILKASHGIKQYLTLPAYVFYKYKLSKKSVKLGFSIPLNVFDKGLSIAHFGTIVVSSGAKIGMNCRIHEGVTIGATNGSAKAAVIGKNVFIASGAKIIGEVVIADDVAIGANAVVVKSILEPGTTWAGVPARKISDHDSHSNLSSALFD